MALEVRQAYFQYLQAQAAAAIYAEADQLLAEAIRATRSRIANGVELPLARTSLKAEQARNRAERTRAETQAQNARAYLNYLLGRPLAAELAADSLEQLPPTAVTTATTDRAELEQLRTGLRLNEQQQVLEDTYFRPKLGLQVDLGSQAFNFAWQPYVLAGVSLDIPLWDNRMHRRRQEALTAEREAQQARLQQTEEQIDLQVLTLRDRLAAERTVYEGYLPAVTAAERSVHDTQRLYTEGQGNYLQLVDARTRLTQTQLQQSLALYQTWITYAELLRAQGNR